MFDETDLQQHMMKILFGCGLYAAFRGSQEHTQLSRSQLSFGTYPSNFETEELRGKKYVSIANMTNDKTHNLSVSNSYVRSMESHLRFPIEPCDPSSFGAALERLVAKMGPGQLRLYCKEASPSYKRKMALDGFPGAQMYPNKPLGRSTISKLFSEGALVLGLPSNFLPHSLRGACITKMVNDQSVSIAETMAVARHSSVAASRTYQRTDGISEGNRLRALGILGDNVPSKDISDKAVSRSTSPAQQVIVELDQDGIPVPADSVPLPDFSPRPFPLTQVGIEDLRSEISEVQHMMSAPPQKPSTNQQAIMELRNVVKSLKKQLENRDNDILYFRSMDHDNDVELQKLRQELREMRRDNYKLKRENDEYSRICFDSGSRGSRGRF